MGASEYLANAILGHIVGKTAFAMPTGFLGLSTTDPDTAVTEPAGGGYARVQTSGSDWNTPASKALTNAAIIAFAQASGSWGTPAWAVMYDALTGGNELASGAIGTPAAIGSGDTARFPAGDITLTMN